MKEKLLELDSLQKELEAKTNEVKALKKEFEETLSEKVTAVKELEQKVKEIKAEIEPLALKESTELGKKSLDCGIVVKSTKSLVYDSNKALEFAKEKGLWLNLDKKGFETTAKTMLKELDWIEEKVVDKVTFPKTLKL